MGKSWIRTIRHEMIKKTIILTLLILSLTIITGCGGDTSYIVSYNNQTTVNKDLVINGSINQTTNNDFYSFLNIPYAGLTFHDDATRTVNLITQNVFENVTVFDVNTSHGVFLVNNYTFNITYSGVYKVSYSMSFTGATDTYEMGLAINNVVTNMTSRPHRQLANVFDVGNMAGGGTLMLQKGDLINLQIRDQDNPVNDPDIISTDISLFRVSN